MVRAIMIVEMAGKPPEYVKESLEKHIGVLNDVKDIEVHGINVSEPREIEGSNGMFTCFAEADFETENFARLTETMFDFMPSSVEVIEPSSVKLDAAEATGLLNNISGRLHKYDEVAKIAQQRLYQMNAQLEAAAELVEKGKKVKRKVSKKKAVKKKVKKK